MIDRHTLAFERLLEWYPEDEEWYQDKLEWWLNLPRNGPVDWSLAFRFDFICDEEDCDHGYIMEDNLFAGITYELEISAFHTIVDLTDWEAEELLDDDIRRIQDQGLAFNRPKKSKEGFIRFEDFVQMYGLRPDLDDPA